MTSEEFLYEFRNPSEFIEARTSGSTGKPKPIKLLKSDMRASARATVRFFALGPESRIGTALSADYIAGKMMAVRALEAGCELVELPVAREFDLEPFLPLDFIAIVPAQIPALISHSPEALRRIGNVLVGGAPMDDAQRAMLVASGLKAWESYGMTETCSHVAVRPVSSDCALPFEAMPGISFAVDSRGCLCIESENFSWRRIVTNDCVELLDGRHFLWRGRVDNVVISGGLKLHPEELEREYAPALEGVEYCVVGRPDSRWGSAVVLVVEGAERDGIMQALESVVRYRRHLPKKIEFRARIPRTPNGKIRRAEL